MNAFERVCLELEQAPRRWLVTGAAGFIGSALVEALLARGQEVVALDNYSTGYRANLDDAEARAAGRGRLFRLEGDVRDPALCARACRGVQWVLHQAALGSVPLSLDDPGRVHDHNVTGFVQLLGAAREEGVARVVYASSSAVYGNDPAPAKREEHIGEPLSPYAVSKAVDEAYAAVFARCYGLEAVGLRYFNIFGRRQDPAGAYAAVIPRWVAALLRDEPCELYGDGETTRDFCHVADVVQANLLAACAALPAAHRVYNVGRGDETTLRQLFAALRDAVARHHPAAAAAAPAHLSFRAGDIRHSRANVERARTELGFAPLHDLESGLAEAVDWYVARLGPAQEAAA
jgi:UDP-N-acetylglucosamine 4-epimerase